MHVKICGLTRAEDALLARKLGAWALGFIFYEGSKRCIGAAAAASIISQLPKPAPTVGVFVDQTKDIASIAQETKIAGVQLHGDETPEECLRIKHETGCFVIKAVRLKTQDDVARISLYKGVADYILLDAAAQGAYGGTGVTGDWELAASAVKSRAAPFILAGGLNENNIAQAARHVRAYAYDLASGVESAPGVKDADKLSSLFALTKGLDDE